MGLGGILCCSVKMLCELLDSSAHCSAAMGRQGKVIPDTYVNPWSLPGRIDLFQIICHQVANWPPQGIELYQGLSVGLCCSNLISVDEKSP